MFGSAVAKEAGRYYLITIKWEQKSRFPTSASTDTRDEVVASSLALLLVHHQAFTDISLDEKSMNASLLLPMWPPVTINKGRR